MASRDEELMVISDMITIAYFFLLRPGEYTSSKTTTPFSLQDAGLYCGGQRFGALTSSEHAIRSSTNSSLEFTKQKNTVRSEVIAHGASTDPVVCPTAALVKWELLCGLISMYCALPPHRIFAVLDLKLRAWPLHA